MKKPLTFICKQKIKFILHVFLEILRRYCKLIALGTLAMSGYTSPKWYYQFVENFCVYLQAKNQLHPPCFSGDIAKIYKRLILGNLGIPCIKLRCLSAYQKQTSSLTSFLRYHILKNPVTWLVDSILANNSRTRILPDMGNINNISFHFRLFQRKTNEKPYFGAILGAFCLNSGKNEFSWKKGSASFRYSNYLPSSHKSEKTIEPFLRKTPNWRTDWQRDGQIDNGDFMVQ